MRYHLDWDGVIPFRIFVQYGCKLCRPVSEWGFFSLQHWLKESNFSLWHRENFRGDRPLQPRTQASQPQDEQTVKREDLSCIFWCHCGGLSHKKDCWESLAIWPGRLWPDFSGCVWLVRLMAWRYLAELAPVFFGPKDQICFLGVNTQKINTKRKTKMTKQLMQWYMIQHNAYVMYIHLSVYWCICTCEGRNHRQRAESRALVDSICEACSINYINVSSSVVKTLPPIQINMNVKVSKHDMCQ